MIPFIRKAAKQVPSGKHFGLDDRSKSIPLLFPPEKHAKRMKDVPSEIVDEVARLCACAISGFRTSRLKRETQGDRERERGNGSIRSLEGVVLVSRYLREVSLMSMFATLGGGFLGRPDGMLAGELVARHRITHSHGPPARVTPLSDPASQTESPPLGRASQPRTLSLLVVSLFFSPHPTRVHRLWIRLIASSLLESDSQWRNPRHGRSARFYITLDKVLGKGRERGNVRKKRVDRGKSRISLIRGFSS